MMTDTEKIASLVKYYIDNGIPILDFNLIGIRNEADMKKDVINDWLGYWSELNNEIFLTRGTTDPGVHYTITAPRGWGNSDRHPHGTFHLLSGYQDGIWIFGIHNGLHEALVNHVNLCRCTKGWRDANYNFVFDAKDRIVCGHFGVNLHTMVPQSGDKIGQWSAGCQVVRSQTDFRKIISKAKLSAGYIEAEKKKGKKDYKPFAFSYMLFNTDQMPEGFVKK